MYSKFDEITNKLEKDGYALCNNCGVVIDNDNYDRENRRVKCKNGHVFDEIFWIPVIDENKESAKCNIWLRPSNYFTMQQLQALKDILKLSELNLVQIKNKYANGEKHLLFEEEYQTVAQEILEKFADFAIKVSFQEIDS